MAVYFDNKIQSSAPGTHSDIAWHKNFPILAVATISDTAGGAVNLYLEEGEPIVECNKLHRQCPASSLAWHPTKKILAVGWESGELVVWNEGEHELYEGTHFHRGDTSILQWTSNGTRLLSGDANGLLVVWKADSRGRLQQTPICQHNMGEAFTSAILKPPPPVDPNNDISTLARAAVSGDESALDAFNWKKGKGNLKISGAALGPQEAQTYFIGGQNGNVYYLNENGKINQQFSAEGPVKKLLYYEEKQILITVTTNMMLTQHAVAGDGETREMLKVKLSGKSQDPELYWAGKGVLATVTGESLIRMWDLDREENYILSLSGQIGYDPNEMITSVSYCTNKGLLAGGTTSGHIAMWNYSPALGSLGLRQEPEDRWKLQPAVSIDVAINQITWGSSKNLLAANTFDSVYILSEQVMSKHYRDETAVVQTGPMSLSVDMFASGSHQDLKTDIQIKGVFTTKEALAIWDGKKVVVYEIGGDGSLIRAAGTFSSETSTVCLYEQNVYTLETGKVQVRTYQGTVKQLLNFTEVEGDPVCMEVCKSHLVVGSANGFVKIFDLTRREAKQSCNPKNFVEVIPEFGSLVSVKCNCNGTRTSVIVCKADGRPDPKVYLWDSELDSVQYFNFETGKGEQDDYGDEEGDVDTSDAERGKNQAAKDIAGRHPISHHWDTNEQKLLVCEAKILPVDQQQKKDQSIPKTISLTTATMEDTNEVMMVSLFITQEHGVLIQDSFSMQDTHNHLLGMEVPYYYFTMKADQQKEDENINDRPQTTQGKPFQKKVHRQVMRDFVGLENADKSAREAMMDFSFYLTIGNMDEAFKAIKLIKSESVWENMAKMCVKTRRLDVATVCLGNMGHARGAKALREAQKEPELDARVAMLAIQLGLDDDAERLLKNCKRYDLVNEFYQSTGQWGKAMETAEMYDRVHLRTTYYNYAKHLESKGEINGAIPNYEKSGTHRFEVPRMLFDEPQALESYIMKTKDKALRKWWAQYMESTGEMETALQFYEAAHDFLSLVRVYCYCNNINKAAEICRETGDRAACYHLARQYENNDEIKQAIHFFTTAQAYGNAIRLCKEHGDEDKLMNLALLSNPHDMVEAARHYESKPGSEDKAVMLYHKAGHFSKALDLAFRTKQFSALQMISEDLDDKTDPELLKRCADFFIENGQYDRAVDLLAVGKKYWEALKLCMEQHVPVNEDLVEKLTPEKEAGDGDSEERNKILEGIAEVCMQQRQYHLATKKYTQAGNKAKAMKALLKSGDTDKIIFFAGVSRQKEIYVMAANYLQSLDWRKDPEIMKNIISFYTKGRALDSLASFYDACAQVEIDEYQNYDKALGALNEAYKCMAKAKTKNQSLQEEKLGEYKRRMGIIKKFVQARRVYEEDSEEAIKQCQVLLEEAELDQAVRMGDVFGFMVEHYAKREKWKAAYSCLEEMKSRIPKVNLTFFVNVKTVESIHRALDIPYANGDKRETNGIDMNRNEDDGEGEEFVEEDVVDDIYDQEQSNC